MTKIDLAEDEEAVKAQLRKQLTVSPFAEAPIVSASFRRANLTITGSADTATAISEWSLQASGSKGRKSSVHIWNMANRGILPI